MYKNGCKTYFRLTGRVHIVMIRAKIEDKKVEERSETLAHKEVTGKLIKGTLQKD